MIHAKSIKITIREDKQIVIICSKHGLVDKALSLKDGRPAAEIHNRKFHNNTYAVDVL